MIILISLIFIAVCSLSLNALYKRTNAYRNQFIDVRKFTTVGGISNNLEIVNLGSNHPKFGFDYTGIDVRGENWAVGPETFEYDYIILRKYVSHLAPGAVVVIPVCLFNFFLYRFDNLKTYLKYYHFLDKNEFPHYTLRGKIEFMSPILFNPKLIRYLIKDTMSTEIFTIDYNPLDTDEDLHNDANKWIRGWEKQFNISINEITLSEKNKIDILKNIQILKEMIEYCLSKTLKPVITILPVTNFLYSRFTPEFIDRHILSYITEANESKAPVMNYLADERFTDPSLYINSFFFNTKGRKKFTKQFIEDLRAQSIL